MEKQKLNTHLYLISLLLEVMKCMLFVTEHEC